MEQTPTETAPPLNDEELAREIRESAEAEAEAAMPRDRADRFYDRIRHNVERYVERKGGALGKTAEFLLLVPDMFILLWRLANDRRVTGKDKVLLGSALAYYVFPLDIIPEAIVGPIGYLDDLVFGVYVVNKLLTDVDAEVVREHWSGRDDVLHAIQRVLGAADMLVGTEVLAKIKSMVGRRHRQE